MASRGTKKVLRKIFSKTNNLDPNKCVVSWNKAVKYIQAKDKRLAFNAIFKPAYAEMKARDIKEYLAGGHKLTTHLKKEIMEYAKEKAKAFAKAQIASKAAAQQGGQKQEAVHQES